LLDVVGAGERGEWGFQNTKDHRKIPRGALVMPKTRYSGTPPKRTPADYLNQHTHARLAAVDGVAPVDVVPPVDVVAGSAAPRQDLLALENGVTGVSNTRKAKNKALALSATDQAVAKLVTEHRLNVSTGDLVFVSVAPTLAEGEMAVGFGKAMQIDTGGDDGSTLSVAWYVRKEWVSGKNWAWSQNPTFIAAGDPDQPTRPYVTPQPLASVLPVLPLLTSACKRTEPRLNAECVRLLRAYCVVQGLTTSAPTTAESADEDSDAAASGDSSESESRETDGSESESETGDSSESEADALTPVCKRASKRISDSKRPRRN